jgi:hypothetical protein
VFDAKGGEIKAKANGSATTWQFWKTIELELFDLSKYSYCQNLVSHGENLWLWENGGVFGSWSFSLLDYLSICPNKWVWLRDRKMNLICKNKPSGGKERSKYVKYCKRLYLFSIALMLHFYLLLFLCWHKSPKRGRLKGKCALGPFLIYFGD